MSMVYSGIVFFCMPSRVLSLCFLFTLTLYADFSDDLTVACEKGNLAEVKRIMGAGMSKDEKHFAIRSASKNGHADVVKYLISQGAPLGDRDFPPLIDAAMQGHAEVVRLLLRAGASIDEGDQASALCLTVENPQMVDLLIKARADVNRECNGTAPLFRAADFGHAESVKMLLAAKADIFFRTEGGDTALIVAAFKNRPNVVKLLLDSGAGASLRYTSSQGKTVLEIAQEQGAADILGMLKIAERKFNTRSVNYAAQTKSVVVLRLGPSRATQAIQCQSRTTLPKGFRVQVLEETTAPENIGGVRGRWLRIKTPTDEVDCTTAVAREFWIFGGLVELLP